MKTNMLRIAKKLTILGISIITLWFISPCITLADGPFGFWDIWWVPQIDVPWTEKNREDSLLHTIQTAINWVLGILATITLVLCIYAGFLMLVSGWDSKKYEDWFNILKSAALWLAIIGTSRLIVSLIFYVIMWSVNPNIEN